jgi:Ca2+-binding RTX toxin-like protein
VTINASGLTGSNRITVVGTNLGGGDTITGGAGADTIDGGAGADTITGGAGVDTLTGGTGADIFVIGTVAHLAAGETINGTAEAGTIDTLRLSAAGTYNLSTFTTITNIDSIAFNVNAAGFNLTVVDSQVSTADANGDGTLNDLQVSASLAMTNAVTINASALTGSNRITVAGTNLGGGDTITGGAGADTIDGGAGADTINGGAGADTITGGAGVDNMTGGTGADHFVYMATSEGTDTIADFNVAQGDMIDILASAFGGGLTAGTDPATVFGSSASNTFGSASERLHYNTATGQLLYDADGTGAGAAVTLATFTGLPAFTAANLDFI